MLVGVEVLFGRWTVRERQVQRRAEKDVYYRSRLQQMRERHRQRRGQDPLPAPTRNERLLVGWTGMRGILTLAEAASIPEHTASGEEFPGRAAIQAIALFVTLGTLLLQGTTVGWLARRLKFDLSAERAATEAERERGNRIAAEAAAQPAADVDAGFEAQRLAVATAVRDHQLSEEIARELIEDIDLRQAARHITPT